MGVSFVGVRVEKAEAGTIRTLPAARRETTGLPRGYTGAFPKIADTAGYRAKQGRIENKADSLDRPLCNDEDSQPMGDFVPDHTAAAAIENIEEQEYQEQLHEALEAALEAIPEKYSQVLQLRYFQNKSLSEAGAVIVLALSG